MRSAWKAVVMAGALALCQVILVGDPGQVTAATFDLGLGVITPTGYTPGALGFNFGSPTVAGDVFSFDSSGNVSFGSVRPPVGPRGTEWQEFSFLGGSAVGFGLVAPRPGPRGTEGTPSYDLEGSLLFASGSIVSLGGVTPRPSPPRDEAFFLNYEVTLDGAINILGDVDAGHVESGKVYIFSSPFAFSGEIAPPTGNWTIGFDRENGLHYLYAEYHAPAPPSSVPEPSTMILLGSGMIGLIGLAGSGIRRRFRKIGSK